MYAGGILPRLLPILGGNRLAVAQPCGIMGGVAWRVLSTDCRPLHTHSTHFLHVAGKTIISCIEVLL